MISPSEIILRLALAALFGSLIGLERGRISWSAGLRTHMLVAVGASLFMIVSMYGFNEVLAGETEHIRMDPGRVAAQVVSGIGFIGAGTILFLKQGAIRGLTTAAGVWTVAAIGLATGGGMYVAAGATTIIVLIILLAMLPLERYVTSKDRLYKLRVFTNRDVESNVIFEGILTISGIKIDDFTLRKNDDNCVFEFILGNINELEINSIIQELKLNPSVQECGINVIKNEKKF